MSAFVVVVVVGGGGGCGCGCAAAGGGGGAVGGTASAGAADQAERTAGCAAGPRRQWPSAYSHRYMNLALSRAAKRRARPACACATDAPTTPSSPPHPTRCSISQLRQTALRVHEPNLREQRSPDPASQPASLSLLSLPQTSPPVQQLDRSRGNGKQKQPEAKSDRLLGQRDARLVQYESTVRTQVLYSLLSTVRLYRSPLSRSRSALVDTHSGT